MTPDPRSGLAQERSWWRVHSWPPPTPPTPPTEDIDIIASAIDSHEEMLERLDDFFEHLAMGNQGKADILELRWDAAAMALRYHVRIRHRHKPWRWGPNLYSVTMYVQGHFNPFAPSAEATSICVDTPVGRVCATIGELARYIAGLF